jgi:hypothetical protein
MQTQGSSQQQSTGGMACATQATISIGPISATQVQSSGTIGVKKEKQRPETWNKIEQQIFFNALRQVGFSCFCFCENPNRPFEKQKSNVLTEYRQQVFQKDLSTKVIKHSPNMDVS